MVEPNKLYQNSHPFRHKDKIFLYSKLHYSSSNFIKYPPICFNGNEWLTFSNGRSTLDKDSQNLLLCIHTLGRRGILLMNSTYCCSTNASLVITHYSIPSSNWNNNIFYFMVSYDVSTSFLYVLLKIIIINFNKLHIMCDVH